MYFSSSPAFPACEDFCLLLHNISEASPLLRPANASKCSIWQMATHRKVTWWKNYCATEYADEGVGPLSVLRENEYKETSQIRKKWNEDILTT